MNLLLLAPCLLLVVTSEARAQPPPLDAVSQVAVGDGTSTYAGCAARTDGRAWCWGGPNAGHAVQQRWGTPIAGPAPIAAVGQVAQVALGAEAVCVRRTDGRVRCGAPGGRYADTGVRSAVEIAGGVPAWCARLRDGRVACWGENHGFVVTTRAEQSAVRRSTVMDGVQDAVHLGVWSGGACAVRSDGRLVCWGAHPWRPPSHDDATLRAAARPMEIRGIDDAVRVTLGSARACVLRAGGRPWCAEVGSRGDAAALAPLEPSAALTGAIDVRVHGDRACTLLPSGEVWCSPRAGEPASRVDGVADATQIAVFHSHACALTRRETIACWGANALGQLGDGTTAPSSSAREVVSLRSPLLREPPHEPYGCTAGMPLRRSCTAMGEECTLQPPPGYWRARPSGVTCRPDDPECTRRIEQQLAALAVPACMCTCDPAYRQAWDRSLDRDRRRRR